MACFLEAYHSSDEEIESDLENSLPSKSSKSRKNKIYNFDQTFSDEKDEKTQ
jgi:hypothetical protein